MEWWQTLLMTAGTCLVTLIVTFVFNWFTNRPKIRRQREEEERKRREQEQEKFRAELKADVQDVHNEALKQNDACKRQHECLATIVSDIQKTNRAQNLGLQAVLKDVLKIRYLEWINKGYAPMDAKDDLEHMFQVYEKLGKNGVMNDLRNKFLALPVAHPSAPEEKKKEN